MTLVEGDPAEAARQRVNAMWSRNASARSLGIELETVEPGAARLSMNVTDAMVNGHGLCHGGYIFMLADSAFAAACSSASEPDAATSCHIAFIAPGRLGMRLIAEARRRHRARHGGIYDVTITASTGETIAEFRGYSRAGRDS
jgi:acyl-CoA thioesterase